MQVKPKYISLEPFLPWFQLPKPISWDKVFGRSSPLVLEIGFGRGEYLVRRALDEPYKNFVGIEIGWISIRKLLRSIGKHGIKNIKVIQADARVALEWVFAQKSLSMIYSLFPCPWPKKRHQKHRLFSRDFLRLVNSRLQMDGELMVVTDHMAYCHWILAQSQGSGLAPELERIGPSFATKYEKKWTQVGQKEFFRLIFRKLEHIEVPEREEISLKTHRVRAFFPEKLTLRGHKDGVVVEFKEMLYDPLRQKTMIRALVVEGPLRQDFWVQVVKRGDQWIIGPAKGCSLVPTQGVQRVLDLVFEAISSQQA